MKILIVVPDIRKLGGIEQYYSKLKNKFTIAVEYFTIGERLNKNSNKYQRYFRLINDYFRFIKVLKKEKYDIIHINPSLDFIMFFREGIFSILAKIYKKRTIIFFRGWYTSFEQFLGKYGIWIFKIFYGNANTYVVLANEFKEKLHAWGCTQPIYREVTIIEDEELKEIDIQKYIDERLQFRKKRILFLARITKGKGIYETIDAVCILNKKYRNLELVIAGNGNELNAVMSYAKEINIDNVIYTGNVRGITRKMLLKTACIFCMPTYSEGMPNSIVEAMSYGLPIITRPVGGIIDFFKNGEHGFSSFSKDPQTYANFIEILLNDEQLYRRISLSNYKYAISNFLASEAAKRLERIYKSTLLRQTH
ncbi:MAG: glycosyltransferase family 4 protein [Candidatus Helarchaeota archaeon]